MIDRIKNILTYNDSFGNKAKNLSILLNNGILAPEGISISFEHYLDYIRLGRFSERFSDKLIKFLNGLPGPYAVRSSANVEDSNSHSYAGQFVTRLGVPLNDIFNAIQEVYQSAINFNRLYSHNPTIQMGIVIQTLLESECSGVLFSYNLIEQDPNSIMVEVTSGRCEKLVSGKVNPSLYIIDKYSGNIKLFEEGDQRIILESGKLKQILAQSRLIESIFGVPQDIEFLFNNNRFYCLQSRSITTIPK